LKIKESKTTFGLALSINEKAENFAFLFGAIKDAAKVVHNIGYSPNILIADSATSITHGFKQVIFLFFTENLAN
jgi:hypothetical protein